MALISRVYLGLGLTFLLAGESGIVFGLFTFADFNRDNEQVQHCTDLGDGFTKCRQVWVREGTREIVSTHDDGFVFSLMGFLLCIIGGIFLWSWDSRGG